MTPMSRSKNMRHSKSQALLASRWSIPTPIEGEGGGGQNQRVEFLFFFAWKPWDSDPTLRMEL